MPRAAAATKRKPVDPPFAPPPAWAMKRDVWPIARFKPYPNNPRTHPADQIELLARLLKKYGPDQDIVVDEDDLILKGHGRLESATLAGLEHFPVTIRTGLTAADKAAMRIADNQVALLSGWNYELVRAEAQSLKLAGYDMPLLCFDGASLDWMTAGSMVLDAEGEWGGMPHFNNPDAKAYRSIVVHFHDQGGVEAFAKATKQDINDKTRFLWYPEIKIQPFVKYAGAKNGGAAPAPKPAGTRRKK